MPEMVQRFTIIIAPQKKFVCLLGSDRMGALCSKNQVESNFGVWTPPPPPQQQQLHRAKDDKPLQQKEKQRPELFPVDEFYDGIPRYTAESQGLSLKSRSVRSVAKVTEVSSRLGRAGMEVLDTLGSSMTSLNANSGFTSGGAAKGSEISILAFEVANTIMKGSNLMQSLSKRSVRQLKEHVLPSEGVQNLVSKDMNELLRIVAADKREELKIFSGEVVRFGNRSKDPQWHNLDRYFEKISRELTPQKQLRDEADMVMQQLITLVQSTAELYHELHSLDRFELDYERKRQEESNSISNQRGDNLGLMKTELKNQRKAVKTLKKKSLWCRSLEEVMEKLVDIVHFLHLEIHNVFQSDGGDKPEGGSPSNRQKLGPAGLSLHYANIIIQIDNLVARSSSVPPNSRDTLYQGLPPSIKSSLRSRIQSFHVKQELTVTEIKDEMEKTLHWLAPIATNTAKAHHGFGWVGEWANTGSDSNRKTTTHADLIRIETLHHADREKTEAYMLELLLWLHHLINRVKSTSNAATNKSPINPSLSTSMSTQNQHPTKLDVNINSKSLEPTIADQDMFQIVSKKKRNPRVSKSQDFDKGSKIRLERNSRMSKSWSYSSKSSKEFLPFDRVSSRVPVISTRRRH